MKRSRHRELLWCPLEYSQEVGPEPSLRYSGFVDEITKSVITAPFHLVSELDDALSAATPLPPRSVVVLHTEPEICQELIQSDRPHVHHGDEIEPPVFVWGTEPHNRTLCT